MNAAFRPQRNERIIYVARRHWIALVLRSLPPLLAGASAALVFGVRALGRSDLLGQPPPLLDGINAVMVLVGLLSAAALAYVYFDWRNDRLFVTNTRVVHEDRTLWLAFRFETIPVERIQNVNIRTDNPLQYVLKYGRAEIQAAGPTAPIVFERANCPAELQRSVMSEVNRHRRDQEQQHLDATVQRRLRPDHAPGVTPPLDAARAVPAPAGLWGAVFPLGPQQQGGTIVWHRHWVILVGLLLWPLAGLVAWSGLFWALVRYDVLAAPATAAVLFVLLLVVLGGFLWQFENWRNDVYVLEPTKIVDVQRLPLGLFEDRREATLGVIQNINATSPNVVARLLGYGDVLIETAGAAGNFTFDHVPDPDRVQRIVFEYQERFRWQQQEREWNNTLNIVEQYLRAQSGEDGG